jgi:hypothetical protein
MMLIRYITQIGRYSNAKRNFYQTNQMVCYEKLIFIDDLIIDSLGIVAFISSFGGVVAIKPH